MSRQVLRAVLLLVTVWGSTGVLACNLDSDAGQLVKTATEDVLGQLRANKQQYLDNPASFRALVNDRVVPHFDVTRMGQRILGPYGEKASEPEFTAFVDQFTLLLIRTYASALKSFENQQVEYAPARPLVLALWSATAVSISRSLSGRG